MKSQTSEGLRSYMADLERHFALPEKLYLDIPAEDELLKQGKALGLSPAEAERCLLLSCEKRGIGVERLLRQRFGRRIAAAVGDRLLDEKEREELERQGREIFAHAEDPAGITAQLLEEVRREEGALSEAEVKEILLGRVKKSEALAQEDWDEMQRRTLLELRLKDVSRDENDLGELMERARDEHGVIIYPPPNFIAMMAWMCGVAMIVVLVGHFIFHI